MNNGEMTLLYKKVAGCIHGGAIGDAMGGPVEGMHYKYIRQLYPGRVTELLTYDRPADFHAAGSGAYARSRQAGTYTDDTHLCNLILKSIMDKQGRISADDLARTWMEAMDTDLFWHSIRNSYSRIAISRTPVREAGWGNIPDNSSAMCIGPIGVINAGNPEQAALDAYDIASLSHDGYSREAACLIAAAVAEAMKVDATVDTVVAAALAFLPNKETSPMLEPTLRALDLASKVKDPEEFTAQFYDYLIVPWIRRSTRGPDTGPDDERHSPSVDPLESVPCALGMVYLSRGNYVDSVTAAANFGRDCDTIACMAGYIAGTLQGVDAIPAAWVKTSLEANPVPDRQELITNLICALQKESEKAQSFTRLISQLTEVCA